MTSQLSKYALVVFVCILATGTPKATDTVAQGSSEWETAYLTQLAVRDIAPTGNGQAWAVGGGGTILFYDGAGWGRVASPTNAALHAVAFTSADAGWAIGDAGTILRYDGDHWRRSNTPTTEADALFDIALTDAGGWAVGQRFNSVSQTFEGLILHLQDGTWSEIPVHDIDPLNAVTLASPDDGWAVGDAGTILRYDGAEWTVQDTRTNVDLYDVAFAGDEVWAVSAMGIMLHWSDDNFEIKQVTYNLTLNAIQFAAPDAGWSVGQDGTILRYEGGRWSLAQVDMPFQPDLFALSIDSNGVPWVVGDSGFLGLVTSDGWEFAAQPYLDVDMTSIALEDSAGWAAGGQPRAGVDGMVFWQWTERFWVPEDIPDAPPLLDVDVVSEEEAWAVGGYTSGTVWRYAGGEWTSAGTPAGEQLFAVEALASDNVWAAGQGGSLLHFNGTDWQDASLTQTISLYDLHFRAADDGWAVGEEADLEHPRYLAVAYHYDGTEWQPTEVPHTPWPETNDSDNRARLLAVHAPAENDVWAAGNLGVILHYDGNQWSVVQEEQPYRLLDLDFATPIDGWAVGTQGTTLHYGSNGWVQDASPTTATLTKVTSRLWRGAWAVGSQGTFLHHRPLVPARTYLPFIGR